MPSAADFGQPSAADFGQAASTPAAPPTPAGPSASDFGQPSKSDFGAPSTPANPAGEAPKPISTPHDFDGIIAKSAAKSHLDPNLYRVVGLQESGLGTSPNFNAKTGLDKDSNQGHGLWQLDPASGASADDLAKAASDPSFAADYFAGMMKKNLAATHGNLRQALAMYNAGDPNSKIGLAYADQVMGRMKGLDPLHIEPEIKSRLQWHVGHFQDALKNKKKTWAAISHTPELAPITHMENQAKVGWTWLKAHPLEGFGDVLSAGMRESQELVPRIIDPQHYHQAISNSARAQQLRDFGNAVWHPTVQVQEHLQEKFRNAVNNTVQSHIGIHDLLRSDKELDAGIKQKVWQPLQAPTRAIAQTANDFIQQAIADPFTYVDLGADTAGRMLGNSMTHHLGPYVEKAMAAASGTMRAVHDNMPTPVQQAFGHLGNWIEKAEEFGSNQFGVRRDLDKAGFTRDGKKMRIAIENKHDGQYTEHLNKIHQVAHDPEAAAQYLSDHADHLTHLQELGGRGKTGPTKLYQTIEKVADPTLSAETRTKEMSKVFRTQRNLNIEDDSMRLMYGKAKYFQGLEDDMRDLNMDKTSAEQAWANDRPDLIKAAANVGKRAILYNSLPHGLINEGSLVYMAGGLNAVIHGIGAMVRPVAHEDIQFLKDAGALPAHMLPDFKDGGNLIQRADQATLHFSQNVLEHMELGWRVGLMKTLEQKLGPVTSEEDKLMRGWMINDKAGDYRNQNAFTELFRGLGGPFTAFHLGIVPKAFMRMLWDDPSKVKTFQRLGQDYENASGEQISDSSPFSEGAKYAAGLASLVKGEIPQYVTDTLGEYKDISDQGHDEEGIVQHWMDIASHYVAPAQGIRDWGAIFHGDERPNHQATMQERLMDAILLELGKKPVDVQKDKKRELEQEKKDRRGEI